MLFFPLLSHLSKPTFSISLPNAPPLALRRFEAVGGAERLRVVGGVGSADGGALGEVQEVRRGEVRQRSEGANFWSEWSVVELYGVALGKGKRKRIRSNNFRGLICFQCFGLFPIFFVFFFFWVLHYWMNCLHVCFLTFFGHSFIFVRFSVLWFDLLLTVKALYYDSLLLVKMWLYHSSIEPFTLTMYDSRRFWFTLCYSIFRSDQNILKHKLSAPSDFGRACSLCPPSTTSKAIQPQAQNLETIGKNRISLVVPTTEDTSTRSSSLSLAPTNRKAAPSPGFWGALRELWA